MSFTNRVWCEVKTATGHPPASISLGRSCRGSTRSGRRRGKSAPAATGKLRAYGPRPSHLSARVHVPLSPLTRIQLV